MMPAELDALISGVLVRVYESPAAGIYATIHDFERFGAKELTSFRVRPTHANWSVDSCPIVKKKLAGIRKSTERQRRIGALYRRGLQLFTPNNRAVG
jgi:hypothetical protein